MTASQIRHLVVATLAVGGFSLERAWALLPNLEKESLLDPETVGAIDEAELVRRLARSGYDRGPIVTPFMADRLIALHAAVRSGLLAQACQLMRENRLQEAEKVFRSVKGIGPSVFAHFTMLERG